MAARSPLGLLSSLWQPGGSAPHSEDQTEGWHSLSGSPQCSMGVGWGEWFKVQTIEVFHTLQLTVQLLSSFLHTTRSSLFHRGLPEWLPNAATVAPDDSFSSGPPVCNSAEKEALATSWTPSSAGDVCSTGRVGSCNKSYSHPRVRSVHTGP